MSFQPRDVPTPEQLAKLNEMFRKRFSLAELAARHDTPATQTSFSLELDIDWDEEHGRRYASFRDGVLFSLGQ